MALNCFCPVCRDLLLKSVLKKAGGLLGGRAPHVYDYRVVAPAVARGSELEWWHQTAYGGPDVLRKDKAGLHSFPVEDHDLGCWRLVARKSKLLALSREARWRCRICIMWGVGIRPALG